MTRDRRIARTQSARRQLMLIISTYEKSQRVPARTGQFPLATEAYTSVQTPETRMTISTIVNSMSYNCVGDVCNECLEAIKKWFMSLATNFLRQHSTFDAPVLHFVYVLRSSVLHRQLFLYSPLHPSVKAKAKELERGIAQIPFDCALPDLRL